MGGAAAGRLVHGIALPPHDTLADALVATYLEHRGLDRTVAFESRRLDAGLVDALASALRDPPILERISVTFKDVVTTHRSRVAVVNAELAGKPTELKVSDPLVLITELCRLARGQKVKRSLHTISSDITDELIAIALTSAESKLFKSLDVALL